MLEIKFTSGNERGPAIWRDKKGIVHQAVGTQIIPSDRSTFIMWTSCGKGDIPANSAYLGNTNDVNCSGCLKFTELQRLNND